MLERISIGWVWLDRTLNAMIDAINSQKPLGSASIAIEESPNGTLLKVAGSQQQGDGGSGAGPTGGQWCTLSVIDTSTGVCVTKTLTYWGTPPQ
jgi:hypothetical protein